MVRTAREVNAVYTLEGFLPLILSFIVLEKGV
jgi:hypothetical protein